MSFGLVVSCAAQDVVSLGVNPETGLSEIRVNLAGLPTDAKPLDMVLVPAGRFMMGSPVDERGRWSDEGPQHDVTITQPFYLGKHEVTQAQWEVVMGSNPSYFGGRPNKPVEGVSWDNCQTYAERLNRMGQGTFRLPTEAEWEYACRAGTTTRFSFGDALECGDETRFYCELPDQYMWWLGNNEYGGEAFGSKEVGRKLPNPWGLYGMHGNTREWCQDWLGAYSAEPQTDPQGPAAASYLVFRVLRGGRWYEYLRDCRSAYRNHHLPDEPGFPVGLRLLREREGSAVPDWSTYE